MKKIEQLHLEAINNGHESTKYLNVLNIKQASYNCSQVTEQIAIEFAEWILENNSEKLETYEQPLTIKEKFQQFLKLNNIKNNYSKLQFELSQLLYLLNSKFGNNEPSLEEKIKIQTRILEIRNKIKQI